MTDLELEFSPSVARALDGYAQAPERTADWQDVLWRAGVTPTRGRRRRWFALAAAAAVLVTLSLATPLGGAIRDRVVDFSAWLRGEPGEPVSAEEQHIFEEQNSRSYAAFPGSPKLRRLTRAEIDGVTYDLLGFRAGGSLCVRLVASGAASGSTTACAPVDDLRNDDAPVRVLLADWPVGKGEKTARIGFDTYRAPRARVTAGIAADGVETVELVDENGSHRVEAVSNSFFYVAMRPDVAQRVTHVRAHLGGGRTVGVPFTPALWGPGGGFTGSSGEPGGPTRVERVVHGGTIGWLEQREERGEPLPDNVHVVGEPEFGRVIRPDPGSSKRIAVTISTLDIGPHTGTPGVCYTVITRGGSGGGCAGAPGELFKDVPFTFGYTVMGAGDQYATFDGIASDDVARLEIFTATGNRLDVALRDNAFLAEVALARLPAKMVAYDAEGRVIGIRETPRDEGPQTPVGEPILRLSESADGSSLELLAYRTKEGGQCWFGRGTNRARVNMGGCIGKEWRNAPLRVGFMPEPPLFVYGRVRDEVKRITVRYADGDELQIEPERYGYVLFAIPPAHRHEGSRVVEFVGHDAQGQVVARQRLAGRPR
jgi:hypothetical protein